MKNLWLALAFFVGSGSTVFANGGAWQTGIPATGNASASKNDQHTDVTIENETLKIDLHPEYADVTVRYRMHNTGPKVQQDFFFPVERWGANPDSDNQGKSDDIDRYQITVDGKELKWTNVAGPKEQRREAKEKNTEANQEGSETEEATNKSDQERRAAKAEDSQAREENSQAADSDEQEGDETRLRGRSGSKSCPRSSHGRNRSFLSSEIRRGT
jgi:hypothetical protein